MATETGVILYFMIVKHRKSVKILHFFPLSGGVWKKVESFDRISVFPNHKVKYDPSFRSHFSWKPKDSGQN